MLLLLLLLLIVQQQQLQKRQIEETHRQQHLPCSSHILQLQQQTANINNQLLHPKLYKQQINLL